MGQLLPDQSTFQSISQASTRSLRNSQENEFTILEDTIADSQPTQVTESSALSERHPNSQSDRRLPSVRSKDDEVLPSVEASENSSSLVFVNTSDLPLSLDSRPPPRAPTLSSMSQTPQAQMSASPRASPGGSGKVTLKQQLAEMRASSRAQAAARRTSGREPGRSPSITSTNDIVVQANRFRSAPILKSQQPDLSQPQSAMSSQVSSPERPGSPAAPIPNTTRTLATPQVAHIPGAPSDTTSKTQNEAHSQVMPASIETRIETRPLEVPVEVPITVRVSQPDAHTPTHPSNLSFHEEIASISQVTSSLHPIDLGKMEFAIPLAMSTRVRDQYLAIMNLNGSVIHTIEHTAPDQVSNDTLDEINDMLASLDRVSIHTDLDDPSTAHQREATVEDLAAWAKVNSEKFNFLYSLLVDRLLNDQVHVAIIARAGRLLDIVEDFLKGNRVAYHRPDTYGRSDPGTTRGRIVVSLVVSGQEASSVLPTADLVIALDGSFDAHDAQVKILREHMTNVGQLAPVVHLVVYKSVEHIEKCIPRTLSPVERARRIVSCLTQVGDEVGHLEDDQLPTFRTCSPVSTSFGVVLTVVTRDLLRTYDPPSHLHQL